MGEIGNLIEELQFVNTIIIFAAFAVCFSLAKSYLGLNTGVLHAIIPAGIFFIGNAIKHIYDEYF